MESYHPYCGVYDRLLNNSYDSNAKLKIDTERLQIEIASLNSDNKVLIVLK